MIPTVNGPLCLKGMKDFVKVRGGGYFFMPGTGRHDFLRTDQFAKMLQTGRHADRWPAAAFVNNKY
jgi:hypothetical protein